MSKLRATRAQVIAAAIIVVLAVALGGVGLYGMNARGSENGAQVLENMRLQAILNTAGSGAVDAYVAAAKSEASTKARESGGGMSAVREAAAKTVKLNPAQIYASGSGLLELVYNTIEQEEQDEGLFDRIKRVFKKRSARKASFFPL